MRKSVTIDMYRGRDWGLGIVHFLCLLFVSILFSPLFALAQSEEELRILQMYFKEEELVVTPTRTHKPVSQVAENISVITEKEIQNMNAHTLTDVLYAVPGLQLDIRGGIGSETIALIQGSEFRHVLVIIDGVTQNNLSDNIADISSIPVQHIERIEIIKGPASSSWGSSLGGIINIITKSPEDAVPVGGTLSASYGERDTQDYRAETSGKAGNIGYYVYAGYLDSDGLRPNTEFYENNVYTKIMWDLNKKTDVTFTLGYNKGSRGRGEDPDFDIFSDNDFEYLFSTLSLNYAVSSNAGINLAVRTSRKNIDFFFNQLSTGYELATNSFDDRENGGSVKFLWESDKHNLVLGADYDNGELDSDIVKDGFQRLETWAVFANDTITVNEFSITPGIRYDDTSTNGDFVSPSLGVTYHFDEKTILRAYIARGFSIPPLSSTFATGFFSVPNPDLDVEKVWSYQTGLESTALKYLWLKTTLFRHDISDAIFNEELPNGKFKSVNKEKERRQGIEVEIKTVPVHDTSLFAGFIFVDAENRDTGERLSEIPRYTYDIGIQYNDNDSLNALLKGRYTWWNAQSDLNGRYSDFIWDFNLNKKVYRNDARTAEIFLTVHNIFNSSQYLIELAKNPGRWIEGGMRLNF